MNFFFEKGVYCHHRDDRGEADHITCFIMDKEILTDPPCPLSLALDKQEVKLAKQWKGVVSEVTILAHQGIDLVKEVLRLMEEGFSVRVALPSDIDLLETFRVRALSSLDILIDLMAFDYARPLQGMETHFHAPLFRWRGGSIFGTLKFLKEQGIRLEKVNLGLSLKGIIFKHVTPGLNNTGYDEPCHGKQLEDPEVLVADIPNYLKTHPSAKIFFTSFLGFFQSFIYNPENRDWISFDDDKTLQGKAEWAQHKMGLHGVFLVKT